MRDDAAFNPVWPFVAVSVRAMACLAGPHDRRVSNSFIAFVAAAFIGVHLAVAYERALSIDRLASVNAFNASSCKSFALVVVIIEISPL